MWRIRNARALDRREGREHVRLGAAGGEDVLDRDPARRERIRDQGSVAAPRYRLRAHDRRRRPLGKLDERLQASSELWRFHVVGVPAEAGVSPAEVDRIRARLPEATEPGHVNVGEAGDGEALREGFATELGVSARARECPHIHELRDAVRAQQGNQLLDRARPVTDGADHVRAVAPDAVDPRRSVVREPPGVAHVRPPAGPPTQIAEHLRQFGHEDPRPPRWPGDQRRGRGRDALTRISRRPRDGHAEEPAAASSAPAPACASA